MRKMLFLAASVLAISFAACDKAGTGGDDLTVQVVGDYLGDYVEFDGSSSVTISDVETTITRASNTKINVLMELIPGLVSLQFTADMDDETSFTIPSFTYDVFNLEGDGSFANDVVTINLREVGSVDAFATYTGGK